MCTCSVCSDLKYNSFYQQRIGVSKHYKQTQEMTSLSATQNTSGKASKMPIPTPNTNASTAQDDVSTSQAIKPPFESRKSAGELKFRLASAVSAKIALTKDGRNPSANRGIGFLLQRKEQQENKLNTKDISFQKLARNDGGKRQKLPRRMRPVRQRTLAIKPCCRNHC